MLISCFRKYLFVILSLILISCGTTSNISNPENENSNSQNQEQSQTQNLEKKLSEYNEKINSSNSKIHLLFAGDVMAHEENFVPGKFDRIWKYVAPKIQSADLAFCNLESPVMDSKGWRAYPTFNMHTDYVEEVIKAGFDVFSLANNHTNDQYLKGINSTRNYFKNHQGIWAAGLREYADAPLTYQIVEKEVELKDKNGNPIYEIDENGNETGNIKAENWKILFVAITELLNRPDYSNYVDYYPRDKRIELKNALNKLKTTKEHDLFVVSMHSDEPEYVLKVSNDHKTFCHTLIEECGVDIVWSNHPHVVQTWEKVTAKDGRDAFIMYANGNTISGQRRDPQFKAPETMRDYTGEGIFMELSFEKSKSDKKISLTNSNANLITVLVSDDTRYVLRFLTDELLEILDKAEYLKWKNYLSARKEIMENYLPGLKKE